MSPVKLSTRKFARSLRRQMTKAEVLLWNCLRRDQLAGLRFRRQFPIGPYFADFACPAASLVVEVDGATHWSDDAQIYDARRREFLQTQGWREIRVTNEDVFRNMDGVLNYILATAMERG